ncbi:hypothetical protein QJS10_CPA10g01676 [Acorus calamus]|uniref:Reverse transcriptase n=1 Tax=Acorus calamus TaxID=4465 RepID=A0AAV9DXR4_ACOCL|nr:hypothetical protein QJS10_CPA10g01676 [Acorus calamus]
MIIAGDFNTLLGPQDKRGGAPFKVSSDVVQFREWKEAHCLKQMAHRGSKFTWCNNRRGSQRTWELLDRAMATVNWCECFPDAVIHILPRHISDHAPMLLVTEVPYMRGSRIFRFERLWFDYPDLYNTVVSNWVNRGTSSPMGNVHHKLCRLQGALRRWQRSSIGNLFNRVSEAHQRLDEVINFEQNDVNLVDYMPQIRSASNRLAALQRKLHIFWAQRARTKWIKEGDANTRFFQAKVRSRRSRNHIITIRTSDGSILNLPEEDVLHSLKIRRGRNALMAAKIDLACAYDSVEWPCLFAVLQKCGFPPLWIRWMEQCVMKLCFERSKGRVA